MTKTQISPSARPNTVAAIVERDGAYFGRVINRGTHFTASRKVGTAKDVRVFASGFKSLTAAVKFIEAAA
jgi:ribosomal protein L27